MFLRLQGLNVVNRVLKLNKYVSDHFIKKHFIERLSIEKTFHRKTFHRQVIAFVFLKLWKFYSVYEIDCLWKMYSVYVISCIWISCLWNVLSIILLCMKCLSMKCLFMKWPNTKKIDNTWNYVESLFNINRRESTRLTTMLGFPVVISLRVITRNET